MTPKPDNLPAPADMTLAQLLREMARILDNAGGEDRGAGYSAQLADAAMRAADNLPGWRKIETAPKGEMVTTWTLDLSVDEGAFMPMRFSEDMGWNEYWGNYGMKPSHWYDFGNGAPMPPAPEGGGMSGAKYTTGQSVSVGNGAIVGVVERVIFSRGCTKPLYLVEWWRDGDLCTREFHEYDVSEAQ